MITQIDIDEFINIENYGNTGTIVECDIIDDSDNRDINISSELVRENVNIQVALSDIYTSEYMEKYCHIIGFNNSSDKNNQLKYFTTCFDNVFPLSYNGQLIACDVSKPKKEAIEIFEEMNSKCILNKWLSYTLNKQKIYDIKQVSLYKCDLPKLDMEQSFLTDPYISYMINNPRYYITGQSIDISWLSIDEIETHPLILNMNSIVNQLYIFVTPGIEHREHFEKKLMWKM